MGKHSTSLDKYLDLLMRRKWVFLLPIVISVAGAAAAALWMPRLTPGEYEATATVRLALAGTSLGGSSAIEQSQSAIITNTANYILGTDTTLNAVIEQLGLDTTPANLRRRINVEAVPETEIIEVTARAESPEEARDLANVLAGGWSRASSDFYLSIDRPELAGSFTQVEEAALPETPLPSGWLTRTALALLIAAIAGVGIALVFEYTDRTINSVADAASASTVPILSCLPRLKRQRLTASRQRQISLGRHAQRLGEMRLLNVKLSRMIRDNGLRSLLFTSVWPKEGTSSVAIGAAVGLAADDFEVILVDANLRDPALHRVFAMPRGQLGLTDVLASTASHDDLYVALDKAAQDCESPGLRVLTSGTPAPDSWGWLGSLEMRRAVEVFNQSGSQDGHGIMVIDGPALLSSADTLALASVVSGVVVVCAEGRPTIDDLQRSLSQLESLGATVLGVVYNKAKAAAGLPQEAPTYILSGEGLRLSAAHHDEVGP
jgi:capsular polysaccharide biosynthesis protein